MAEKLKEAWFKWIPGWLPILLALFWIGMQYQRMTDRLDSLEKQIIAIQQYIRNDHDHSKPSATDMPPISEVVPPQRAGLSPD